MSEKAPYGLDDFFRDAEKNETTIKSIAQGIIATEAFADGVIYVCARLIDNFDQPTMAGRILKESGVDMRTGAEYDLSFIRRIPEFANLPTGKE